MTRRSRLAAVGVTIALLSMGLGCQCLWLIPWPPADPLCAEAPFSPPHSDFGEQDLVGTWQTQYGRRIDTLTLRSDGTFKQVYSDPTKGDYQYETAWNRWWLEHFADGRVRLHLEGARYYVAGTRIGELDGHTWGEGDKDSTDSTHEGGALPWPFYDPFSLDHLEMVGELILNVRMDSTGELLLHHMSHGADGGFAMSGCEQDHFRPVVTR
jgi:hypothetical protein